MGLVMDGDGLGILIIHTRCSAGHTGRVMAHILWINKRLERMNRRQPEKGFFTGVLIYGFNGAHLKCFNYYIAQQVNHFAAMRTLRGRKCMEGCKIVCHSLQHFPVKILSQVPL